MDGDVDRYEALLANIVALLRTLRNDSTVALKLQNGGLSREPRRT